MVTQPRVGRTEISVQADSPNEPVCALLEVSMARCCLGSFPSFLRAFVCFASLSKDAVIELVSVGRDQEKGGEQREPASAGSPRTPGNKSLPGLVGAQGNCF